MVISSTWKKHDIYDPGCSSERIVTRSQSCFNRVENTPSDMLLFADPKSQNLEQQPHLMMVMMNYSGSVPNTIVTRSTGTLLPISMELCEKIRPYKNKKASTTAATTKGRKKKGAPAADNGDKVPKKVARATGAAGGKVQKRKGRPKAKNDNNNVGSVAKVAAGKAKKAQKKRAEAEDDL